MTDSRNHQHANGWTSDDVFRSMRRNAEAYKKKDMELIKVKREKEEMKKNLQKSFIDDIKNYLEDFTTKGDIAFMYKDEKHGGTYYCKMEVTFDKDKKNCNIKCFDIEDEINLEDDESFTFHVPLDTDEFDLGDFYNVSCSDYSICGKYNPFQYNFNEQNLLGLYFLHKSNYNSIYNLKNNSN